MDYAARSFFTGGGEFLGLAQPTQIVVKEKPVHAATALTNAAGDCQNDLGAHRADSDCSRPGAIPPGGGREAISHPAGKAGLTGLPGPARGQNYVWLASLL